MQLTSETYRFLEQKRQVCSWIRSSISPPFSIPL